MRASDLIRLASGSLYRQRRRSLLSLVGVAIGVTAVIVLTAVGEGARRYVRYEFRSLGSDLLGVLPGKVETTGGIPGFGGVPHDLTIADAEALRRVLTEARHVAPVSMANDIVSYRDRSREAVVIGATAEIRPIRSLRIRAGSFLPEGPWDREAPWVVLGANIADELFRGQNPVGRTVRLGDYRMRVIGVLARQGKHLGIDMDESVYAPVATVMRMFDRPSLFRIAIETRPEADLEAVKRRILAVIVDRHGEEDVTVMTPGAVLGALESILGMLTLALVGIAAISLSVAGLGIMNVMLVSVSERTGEIGLLEALGAARRQILALFLCEAALLSLAGGLVGLGLGQLSVGIARQVFPAYPAATPPWALLAALATSLAVGIAFGYLPARRAVRLDPVAALGEGVK